jgi:two-component system, chemotaxis family, protein-glutamate methylesterase/glutaminase
MIRVVIADDSATARTLIRSILEAEGDIKVVGEAEDGAAAVELVAERRPDLVIMDVHMPVSDGLAATKEIMVRAPTAILIVSAVTRRDVDLSLSATQAGALMALPKPEGPASPGFGDAARELREMARAMAQVKVVRRWSASWPAPSRVAHPRPRSGAAEVVVLAASTGGPAALRRVLMDLPRTFPAPILLVQHIARDFTVGFAEWLAASCALPVKLAEDGEELRRGTVYVAPDNVHLGVGGGGRARLLDAPAVGGFRPSATVAFEQAAAVYGSRAVCVVLTGMGTDGAAGLRRAHAAGACVIAQDEASSVVFGMAGEAVRLGVVDMVVPLEEIATRLMELVTGEAHGG